MKIINIYSESITLTQFLKFFGLVQTGGEAKTLLASQKILVNGEIIKSRGKKLKIGDQLEISGIKYVIKRENISENN